MAPNNEFFKLLKMYPAAFYTAPKISTAVQDHYSVITTAWHTVIRLLQVLLLVRSFLSNDLGDSDFASTAQHFSQFRLSPLDGAANNETAEVALKGCFPS